MGISAEQGDFISVSQALPVSKLADLVRHVGESDFSTVLAAFLHQSLRIDHCALCRFVDNRPLKVGTISRDGSDSADMQFSRYIDHDHWRVDPSMKVAMRTRHTPPTVVQLDIDRMPPSILRDVVYRRTGIIERILLFGVVNDVKIGISILRSEQTGKFTGKELNELQSMGADLVSVTGKHIELVSMRNNLAKALTDLDTIEERICGASDGLTRREAQVCARLLFGNSLYGIATSLGLGEETVKTYRKRAFARLGIVSKRDLLVWYIRLWDSFRPVPRPN